VCGAPSGLRRGREICSVSFGGAAVEINSTQEEPRDACTGADGQESVPRRDRGTADGEILLMIRWPAN